MHELPKSEGDTPIPMARPIIFAHPIAIDHSFEVPPEPASPLLLPNASRSRVSASLLAVLVIGIVLSFAIQMVSLFNLDPVQGDAFAVRLIAMKFVDAALACILLSALASLNGVTAASFGIRFGGLLQQIGFGFLTLLANYAYMIATIPLVMLLIQEFPELMEDAKERLEFGSMLPVQNFWLSVVLLICVATHEEITFRGLMLPLLRKLIGSWWGAVAISSVIFGALHIAQGVIGVVQITGLGIVFSIAFIRSRSLITVIFAHFAFDLLQFQLLRFTSTFSHEMPKFTAFVQ